MTHYNTIIIGFFHIILLFLLSIELEILQGQCKSILLKLNCCVFVCVCVCLFVRIVLKRWRNKNRTYN